MNTSQFACDFQNLSKYLRAFAMKLTKDVNLAEDLYQDTALRAFSHQDKFATATNMKAWLSTIMKNTFINDFRKKKRWERIIIHSGDNYMLESDDRCTWNEGEAQVRGEALEQLIGQLDPPMRIPFLMMYQGYKYEEIAAKMQLPLGTVKSRIFMARQAIKKKMKALYGSTMLAEMDYLRVG